MLRGRLTTTAIDNLPPSACCAPSSVPHLQRTRASLFAHGGRRRRAQIMPTGSSKCPRLVGGLRGGSCRLISSPAGRGHPAQALRRDAPQASAERQVSVCVQPFSANASCTGSDRRRLRPHHRHHAHERAPAPRDDPQRVDWRAGPRLSAELRVLCLQAWRAARRRLPCSRRALAANPHWDLSLPSPGKDAPVIAFLDGQESAAYTVLISPVSWSAGFPSSYAATAATSPSQSDAPAVSIAGVPGREAGGALPQDLQARAHIITSFPAESRPAGGPPIVLETSRRVGAGRITAEAALR